ncbi:MAG: hypothetical protein AVDCRST_MAG17-705 [uncultured Solirubrobacterales bacterium]|uniref:Uncharacterized protein n=1 Tax=uncultured Solirubrobacterales bacterium TaxID=768556 RepID=A0A6J4S9N5_9ACTN|nr:MAG: hypothetical protein AVDCRST_MAG17-705 [uncultured Solirubrobacterales bacterium]
MADALPPPHRLCGCGALRDHRLDRAHAVIDGDPGVRPAARRFAAYAAPWEPLPRRRPTALRRADPNRKSSTRAI